MDVMERIKQAIESNPIMLFMKGSPEFPQCGFSARVCQVLADCSAEFASINVLVEPDIRANLHRYADWPTFPQLYINGEFVGGCDIVEQMYHNNQLQPMIEQAGE